MLHVLLVTPEAQPFAHTGGLADVAGALPHALARLGHRVTLVLPRYRGVDVSSATPTAVEIPFGTNRYPVTYYTLESPVVSSEPRIPGPEPSVASRESSVASPEVPVARPKSRTASSKSSAASGRESAGTAKPTVASAKASEPKGSPAHGAKKKTSGRGKKPPASAARIATADPKVVSAPVKALSSSAKRSAGAVTVVFIDAPDLFDRDGMYGDANGEYHDNAFRFAVLSRGALEYARVTGERPSVVHAHDWQTGLVPVYLKTVLADDPVLGGVPSVFTIHNTAFQGLFPPDELTWIDVPPELYTADGVEFYGRASTLKAGIRFADRVTTVSPTYAQELLTPDYPFAFGFEGILASRADQFTGILNGVDYRTWDPESDRYLPTPFTAASPKGKADAKRALFEAVGLEADSASLARPTIGILSRLTYQKGFDLLADAAGPLMALDANWILLGDGGNGHYEEFWTSLARTHPDRVAARIGYDERLAHLIHAGSDLFLVPSRYEPCGLNQMYAMRYGTLPIVRATGGLADTVQDADESPKTGTGFVFRDFTVDALLDATRRGLEAFRNGRRWKSLQRNAMQQDHSWDVSAREYVKVYRGTENREDLNGIRKGTDADRRQLRADDQRRQGRSR